MWIYNQEISQFYGNWKAFLWVRFRGKGKIFLWSMLMLTSLIIVNQQWPLPPSGSLLHRLVNPSMSRCIYYKHWGSDLYWKCFSITESKPSQTPVFLFQCGCSLFIPLQLQSGFYNQATFKQSYLLKKIKSEFPCLKIKIYLHIICYFYLVSKSCFKIILMYRKNKIIYGYDRNIELLGSLVARMFIRITLNSCINQIFLNFFLKFYFYWFVSLSLYHW